MAIKVAPQRPRNGQRDPACRGPAASAPLGTSPTAWDRHSSPQTSPDSFPGVSSLQRPRSEHALQDSLETTRKNPSLSTPGSHLCLDTELPARADLWLFGQVRRVEAGERQVPLGMRRRVGVSDGCPPAPGVSGSVPAPLHPSPSWSSENWDRPPLGPKEGVRTVGQKPPEEDTAHRIRVTSPGDNSEGVRSHLGP